MTDLLGQVAASKLFAAQADDLKTLDESISPRLLNVERKSVKSVADLLAELIASNGKATSVITSVSEKVVGELAEIRKKIGAKSTSVEAGVVQFVTKCVPTKVCASAGGEEINAIVAGDCFQDVAGVYECRFTNPAKKVCVCGWGWGRG